MSRNTTEKRNPWFANRREGIDEIDLVSVVVESDRNEPDRCTIYDPETDGFDRMSVWITAKGNSFVDCRRCR
jgi:hypothetical protein